MKLIESIIKRPTMVALFSITIVIFGISAIMGIRKEYFPDMSMPMHVVSVVYPGADADSIEKLVTEKIEDAGENISGIKTIESNSYENYAVIQFTYEYGTELSDAYMELKEQLDNLSGELPDNCQTPKIMEISLDSDATITASARGINGSGLNDIINYINDTVVPGLENTNGVAQVDVSGVSDEYTRLVLDEEKMSQYGVSINDIAVLLTSADYSLPVGSISNGTQEIGVSVHTDMEWHTDLQDLMLQTRSGALIRLGDVLSDIYMAREDQDTLSRFNGEDSILIAVTKRSSASTLKVCSDVEKKLEQYSNSYVEFQVTKSIADDIKDSLMEVVKTLVEGVLLSMLVLFVFFGDIRASLIVGSSMPLSMLAGVALLNMTGQSFELMSGTGMTIAIGMLVDNSIVVLESCFRAKDENDDRKTAAIKGTGVVLLSVVASTLTTIVVYVPMGMTAGMAGQMNKSLSYVVVFTMISSLISAVTVVPTLFCTIKPVEKKDVPINKLLDAMNRGYRKIMPRFLAHPWRPILTGIVLFVLSILLATRLHMDLFPPSYDGSIELQVKFRPGTRLEVVDEGIRAVEQRLLEDENFDSVELAIDGNVVNINAYSTKKSKRDSETAVEYYTKELSGIAGMDIMVNPKSVATGLGALMSTGNNVSVLLTSDDLDALRDGTKIMERALEGTPGVIYINNDFSASEMNARIVVDQRKAAAYGISPGTVASSLYIMLNGMTATTVEQGGKEYDVKVEYPKGRYDDMTKLLDQTLTASDGTKVRIGSIAEVEYKDILQSISRRNGSFVANVTATTQTEGKYAIAANVNRIAQGVDLPDDVELGKSTMDETLREEMGGLGGVIVIAIFLVFMVMAIQFNSVRYSLMVMSCMPFSLIGAFGLLFLCKVPLSMMAMMGFLMLVGMVVNNGILLVDTTNGLKEEMSMDEALTETGALRLRPILMTTLTTVLSMLPILLSRDSGLIMMKGMACVIVGGLITSTILALFLMPPFYKVMSPKER